MSNQKICVPGAGGLEGAFGELMEQQDLECQASAHI